MTNYQINETVNTPKVVLDAENHLLEFEGDSRPEDVQKFYNPIFSWLEQYDKHVTELSSSSTKIILNCNFKFEYFNSSSAKYVMDLINKLGDVDASHPNLTLLINWYYDEMDEDMLDAGQEFEDMLDVKFNFVAIE